MGGWGRVFSVSETWDAEVNSSQKLPNWSMSTVIEVGQSRGFRSLPEADLRCFRGPSSLSRLPRVLFQAAQRGNCEARLRTEGVERGVRATSHSSHSLRLTATCQDAIDRSPEAIAMSPAPVTG